jgi:ATP-dependent exoDNAse (exonuclease V) alpha subunit
MEIEKHLQKEADVFFLRLISRSLPVTVGECLLIRGNLKERGLFNGSIVQVASVEENGALLLTDKRTIPPEFRQFSHGYAATSHAGQGKTIDRGIVLMTEDGIRAANLRQAYVSHSRFEESHMTYTTDKRAAIEAMATPAERKLAMEVIDERIRRWKLFQKLTEQADAWAERRKLAAAAHAKQPIKTIQGIGTHAHQT